MQQYYRYKYEPGLYHQSQGKVGDLMTDASIDATSPSIKVTCQTEEPGDGHASIDPAAHQSKSFVKLWDQIQPASSGHYVKVVKVKPDLSSSRPSPLSSS
mmetsp:Transcript_1798/g.4025  ORF Transcript_1798/g.4025 Transcript_1798/m.4025 type:complete len:100 (-) Transcript_1798:126-425(-)